jgi:hypothetical protein
MSAKIQPWDAAGNTSAKSRARSTSDSNADVHVSSKSPRSPRANARMNRQNSFGDNRPSGMARQNSVQGGSSKSRRNISVEEADDVLTDHSGAASARGPNSARSSKGRTRKSLGSKVGKKRVSFSTPLIDPRPEKTVDNSATYGADYSLSEEEFDKLEQTDNSDSVVPRRMRKRRKGLGGRWRRYLPFGQYIPTLPSIACTIFGFRRREIDYS